MGWLMKIIVLWTYSTISARFCQPEPDLCSECDITAKCGTYNKSNIIPQSLPSFIQHLSITYVGDEDVGLSTRMFSNYQLLIEIKIYGNNHLSFLEKGAFRDLKQLSSLSITNTDITAIPNHLLPVQSMITLLDLQHNALTEIPYHLFGDLPNVINIHLGYNQIFLANCSSIGSQFAKLSKLRDLNLANITLPEQCERQTKASLFHPIQNTVSRLNLTSTNVFGGDSKIFKNFSDLIELDISLAESFQQCPSKAKDLFRNLPPTLIVLYFRRWRTGLVLNESCLLSNITFTGLKKLPRLVKIDVKYGDGIFGKKLNRSVFSGFSQLAALEIGWARFSSVEDGILDGCSNLTLVNFDGNPLGSRPIKLFSNSGDSSLKRLGLRRSSIYSDFESDFYASNFTRDAPIQILDLRYNYITTFPFLISNQTADVTLEKVYLDYNFIENLYSGGDLRSQCKYLPNLMTLQLEQNQIQDVGGLCESITRLILRKNALSVRWRVINEHAISKLKNLQHLDLSFNQLTVLSPNLFREMKNLVALNLAGNNLTLIDSTSFLGNPLLEILDFRKDSLVEFTVQPIQHLHKLKKLLLDNNRIATFEQSMISYIDDKVNSVQVFGIIGNPFQCQCDQDFFQTWIKSTEKVPVAHILTCSGPAPEQNQKVYSYNRRTFDCDYRQGLIIGGSVLIGIVCATLIALPCYKYRWYISHARVVVRAIASHVSSVQFELKCTYDAYIMYNSASDDDLNWVVEQLLPEIEKKDSGSSFEEPLKLYIHDRDALPGTNVYTERITAIEKSRKIILVLSNSYLKCPQCRSQADLAGREAYRIKVYEPNRIMVIVKEALDKDAIKAPFTSLLTKNVIDILEADDTRMSRVWQRIRNFVSKPKYVYEHNDQTKSQNKCRWGRGTPGSYEDPEDQRPDDSTYH